MLLGSRPQYVPGWVKCEVIAGTRQQPLAVEVVLDAEAIKHRSSFQFIRATPTPINEPSAGFEQTRLRVSVSQADGGISGCGTFNDHRIRVEVTNQMFSYPSWIQIIASEPVLLTVRDTAGVDLAEPLYLPPEGKRGNIPWIR
jgi:hypothetical protein